MELFKEISIFGLNFIKAKTGIRINKEEIEEVKKICVDVAKKIDQAADFVNKNKLAEPVLIVTSKTLNKVLILCGFVIILAVLILIFADNLIASLATLIVVVLLCRLLIIVSIVVAVIMLFLFYAELKN